MSDASMLERLSCNIFITNFPAYFSSKDLWNTCSKFGTVLDVYIPNKVSKQGKVYVVCAKEVTGWVPDFWEENSDESEDYSDNNSVGKKNWVESEEVEIIPESVQNDAFIDNIAESKPINGDSRKNQYAHEINDSNPKFPSGFTPQHSDHYEYEKVEALRESTTPQNSKKVRNDQSFHQVLEESVNKSSGVSKTAHVDSMAGPVKQRNGFSILERFQEFIDIGQAMGYKMKWCEKDFRRIITSLGDETKMVSLDDFVVKNLWGNMLFDFATSSAPGRSGEDTWMANNADLLFISFYSPQELSLKRVLWNYMLETLNRWHGEVIIMGDFNERGYSFTWSDKHASKMSKLDRFLVSQGMLDLFLNLTGLILHRHLSGHRPILLKETHVDYGPTPFRLYHSWFLEDDFHFVIEDSWNNDENGLPDDLTKCANLFHDLKDIDHKDSIDLAQKAKIKWAVEGDENSKFFHGIVNKKRRYLAIKGILVDGEWIENPNHVKSEFHSYYSNLFSDPAWDRSLFDVNFPRRLNSDQVFDLEDMVSNEEIKRAVWD
uniref:RNA-directed DNA polymerase, eukaryota n=1 Tax=Tanacetum cinerariifolium TaxID=118510 RepID=A0A699JN79_TANCI|nr:RNA-directed DNA polymerase, eukaryota [Tanacetum cinerariifolium]